MKVARVREGNKPIILAQPHGGTYVPQQILDKLNATGQALADTDWHINRLYDGLLDDITVVESNIHRYVIDANRGPEDESLYPGQNTTGLCPLTDFNGEALYRDNQQPSADEIEDRRLRFHKPYHDALAEQLERVKQRHGGVILYDCHSIRSNIPFLFEGTLPDFNIGSFNGKSCSQQIEHAVQALCASAQGYTHVVNGRFKGGWTTRHYGAPDQGIHAIQMELAQITYMHESAPWQFDSKKSQTLRQTLKKILNQLVDIVCSGSV